MVLVVALVGAALSGAVAWRETQRYKQEHGELFFAIEPKLATAGVAFVAAVIGWIASPIVLGFLVGYALYREALLFEDDQFDGALDVPARMWAGVGFVVGFFGALFTWIHALLRGKKAPANPWGGNTLEWYTASPPPHDNFARQPEVSDPYQVERWRWDEPTKQFVLREDLPAAGAVAHRH